MNDWLNELIDTWKMNNRMLVMDLLATSLMLAMGNLLSLALLYGDSEVGELASCSSLCVGLWAWGMISGKVEAVKMGTGTSVPQSVWVLG